MEIEHFFTCPYCWEEISFVLDMSIADQAYVEDCEVCCRPIQVHYQADGEGLIEFSASAIDD